jgi:hypothetical protein
VNLVNNAKINKLAILILFFMIIFLCLTYSGIAAARDNSQLLVFHAHYGVKQQSL